MYYPIILKCSVIPVQTPLKGKSTEHVYLRAGYEAIGAAQLQLRAEFGLLSPVLGGGGDDDFFITFSVAMEFSGN